MNFLNTKWITSFFLASILLVTHGCDLLDQAPQNTLTRDEFFETGADATASIISAYDALQNTVGRMAELGEARADLVEGAGNNPYRLQTIDPNDGASNWSSFYVIINRANTTIKYVPRIVKKDLRFTQQQSNAILAEAYFLRALAYFYIVRGWGEAPLVVVPSDTDDQDYNIPKSSQDALLDQIEADLAMALKLNIPKSYATPEPTHGRATEGAVNALQTDVYLWRGKFAEAVAAADKVINNKTYRLVSADRWPYIFFDGNTSESIFEIQFDFNKDEINGAINGFANAYGINLTLFEKFNSTTEPDQIRGEWASYSKTNGRLWKFLGADTQGTPRQRPDVNWMVYRLADVLLMKAEALNHLGRREEAVKILETIRTRVNLTEQSVSSSSSLNEVEDAILSERASEFAFEGKRWFDLLRVAKRGRRDVLINAVLAGYPDNARAIIEARILDERTWYLPVSTSELNVNKALIQNSGYL